MNYIINPAAFYWMNITNGLIFVLAVFTAVLIVLGIIVFAFYMNALDGGYESDMKKYKKILKTIVPCIVISALLACFIPSKDTILEMMIAKMATYENASWTLEALKEAVDYIVNALAQLK